LQMSHTQLQSLPMFHLLRVKSDDLAAHLAMTAMMLSADADSALVPYDATVLGVGCLADFASASASTSHSFTSFRNCELNME
jgi:hypothetical protein